MWWYSTPACKPAWGSASKFPAYGSNFYGKDVIQGFHDRNIKVKLAFGGAEGGFKDLCVGCKDVNRECVDSSTSLR